MDKKKPPRGGILDLEPAILIGKQGYLPWERKILEDKVCHLEGDSMHHLATNDGRFYEKYEKIRIDCRHMKNMT